MLFAKRGLFGVFKQEPIKFSTSKVLPYSQENFFAVVKDVQNYQEFIPWITSSKLLPHTIEEKEGKSGRFDGEVKIGFSQLSFAYISHVSYQHPNWILSESENTRIFEGLHSHWEIRKLDTQSCEVVYNIQMTFANPLYSSVTNHFFDYLTNNINQAFEKRCFEMYYKNQASSQDQEKDNAIQEEEVKKHHAKKVNPEDSWVWDYKPQESTLTPSRDLKDKALVQKKQQRQLLVDSIISLQAKGFLTSIDHKALLRCLESSESLFRELINLQEAFGQNNGVYAMHMKQVLNEYGCCLAKQ